MSQQVGQGGLSNEIRFRLPLPIVIPLGALALIALCAVGFAYILLNVPKEVATFMAIVVAANIFAVCAFAAQRPHTARAYWAELFIVATYPLVIGFVLANIGLGTSHSVGEHADPATAPVAAGAPAISAANTQFDTSELTLPADEETELQFVNDDAASVPHNVSIYEEEGGKEIFVGETIPGGQETTYAIPATKKGEYYFQCDVHPGMNGSALFE